MNLSKVSSAENETELISMKTKTSATTAGSETIPQPGIGEVEGKPQRREVRLTAELRSEGTTGASRSVPRDEHKPSEARSHDGQNKETAGAHRNLPEAIRPLRSVFRKTELHGTHRERTPEEKAQLRKKLMEEAGGPDIEALYQPVADEFRSIIDTIIERQDRAQEEMLAYLADLQQRIDAIESTRDQHRSATSDNTGACT